MITRYFLTLSSGLQEGVYRKTVEGGETNYLYSIPSLAFNIPNGKYLANVKAINDIGEEEAFKEVIYAPGRKKVLMINSVVLWLLLCCYT
jgi:hypothetical protein